MRNIRLEMKQGYLAMAKIDLEEAQAGESTLLDGESLYINIKDSTIGRSEVSRETV
ncbi:hypothetical protein QUF79_14710 [Fictibacillus enclensis]|uniref:hypothetical protein n=1 Tax=Fictibacillus enclensis TaxID=1017270 RepID=UPI0025A12AD9|nr:hypothetical protein [Fictibacillus enclensis]MDM5199270.1 hypothetical protein [Fictibacillus enclensis]